MIRTKAFTLIELLTVMAITAILLTLIILPVFQTFNLTRAGQAFSDAQDKGRIVSEKIAREIGTAVSVRDNAGEAGAITVVIPGQDGTLEGINLPYLKLDLVLAAEGDPARGPSGAFINPNTGKEDPTLRGPKGQVVLPVAPGGTLVRWFVGLRGPINEAGNLAQWYNNPYDGLLMGKSGSRDNLYVLYRAEVQPFVWTAGSYRVNTDLFRDDNNDNAIDDLDDPAFFTMLPGTDASSDGTLTALGAEKARRIRNWISRSTVQTEVSRYDMIQPVYTKATRQVAYDGNIPRLMPLIQFRPARVNNEALEGQSAVRVGEEADNAQEIGPDVYRGRFGLWSSPVVRVYPSGWDPNDSNRNEYLVGRQGFRSDNSFGTSVYAFDPDSDGDDLVGGTEIFDISVYEAGVSGGSQFPFSNAWKAANARTGWRNNARLRDLFIPFVIDRATGKVTTSFNIQEVGNAGVPNDPNYPTALVGDALNPLNDNVAAGTFASYTTLNQRFNKVWNDFAGLRPGIHRYVDLRVFGTADGEPSPLTVDPTTQTPRVRVVPGTEVVYGPDQNSGPSYSFEVRYTRTTGEPGPNQYRINYVDQPEPSDYGLLGLTNPPASYTATNFESAVVQPRYRSGYLQLNSDPNVPLPNRILVRQDNGSVADLPARVRVAYRFQYTNSRDIVTVDYDSRQQMNVLFTVRNYPQSNLPNPQTVTLTASASVRNFLR